MLRRKNKNLFLSPLFLRIFIPFGLACFLSTAIGSANAVMSPILIKTFSLSAVDLGSMSSVYLIAFGLAQLPVGVMLDRFGAKKTLAPFMLAAAAGVMVTALARDMTWLVVSRALIGIGFSGGLMAAFKACAEWLPTERLPMSYSLMTIAGGLGGIAATRPLALLFENVDWRVCFFGFAALSVLLSAALRFISPASPKKDDCESECLMKQTAQMLALLKDKKFLLISAVATFAQGVYFAYLYLWIGPWMTDAARLSEKEAGFFMMLAFAGATGGFFFNGVLAEWLEKRRLLSWNRLYLWSGVCMTAFLTVITVFESEYSAALWGIVMFMSTMTMISFPILRREYGSDKAGRAMSLLNFIIFFVSFILQWFVGYILGMYPSEGGHFSPQGYRVGLAAVAALNFAADICYWLWLRREKPCGTDR